MLKGDSNTGHLQAAFTDVRNTQARGTVMRTSGDLTQNTSSETGTGMQNPVGCMGWCSDAFQGMKVGNSMKTPASSRTDLEMELKPTRHYKCAGDVQRTLRQQRAFTAAHASVLCPFASRRVAAVW